MAVCLFQNLSAHQTDGMIGTAHFPVGIMTVIRFQFQSAQHTHLPLRTSGRRSRNVLQRIRQLFVAYRTISGRRTGRRLHLMPSQIQYKSAQYARLSFRTGCRRSRNVTCGRKLLVANKTMLSRRTSGRITGSMTESGRDLRMTHRAFLSLCTGCRFSRSVLRSGSQNLTANGAALIFRTNHKFIRYMTKHGNRFTRNENRITKSAVAPFRRSVLCTGR